MITKTEITTQAIARSISRGEIVHIPHNQANHSILEHRCYHSVETARAVEYWGDSPDEWRVHVDMPEQDETV